MLGTGKGDVLNKAPSCLCEVKDYVEFEFNIIKERMNDADSTLWLGRCDYSGPLKGCLLGYHLNSNWREI